MSIPEGLALQRDVITPEKETEIIAWLDVHPWSTELARRTQHYGYGYDYRRKNLTPGPALEGPILEVAQIIERAGLMHPVQCIVNEYTRSQGITAHIDNTNFGPVVIGLSISGDGVMVFQRGAERVECFLPRRSIVMLSGPARYEWTHSIEKKVTYIDDHGIKITKPQDYRRVSLTYRELA
jgi:alkylated DNA repair dioxygenase AlkB